jgi:hypothetical protein
MLHTSGCREEERVVDQQQQSRRRPTTRQVRWLRILSGWDNSPGPLQAPLWHNALGPVKAPDSLDCDSSSDHQPKVTNTVIQSKVGAYV